MNVQTVASSFDSQDSATSPTISGLAGSVTVDLGETVVQRVDDLVRVERHVERRVDVLGRVADERAAVDELTAGFAFGLFARFFSGVVALAASVVVVIVATTGGEHEREH